MPIIAGEQYTASVYVRRDRELPVRIRIDWYTDGGRNGYDYGSWTAVGDDWVRLTATATAPEGTTKARLWVLSSNDGLTGDAMWVDGWMFMVGEGLTAWLPGQFAWSK